MIYDAPGMVVGGGAAQLQGTGDNARLSYDQRAPRPVANAGIGNVGNGAQAGSFGPTYGYVPNRAGNRGG